MLMIGDVAMWWSFDGVVDYHCQCGGMNSSGVCGWRPHMTDVTRHASV